jgi:hypothetical protein
MVHRLYLIAIAALWVAAALPGQAQDQATTLPSLSPAQEKEIRESVLNEHRMSASIPTSFKLSVGATLPQNVELHAFGPVINMAQYRYTIILGKIVLVEAGSRRIVRILE